MKIWLQGWKEPPPQSARSGEGGPWAPWKEQSSQDAFGRSRHDDLMAAGHVAQPGACLEFISVAGSSCRSSKFVLGVTKIGFDRSSFPKAAPAKICANYSATRPLPKGESLPSADDLRSETLGMLCVQDLRLPSL